jgi:hypothetical protein
MTTPAIITAAIMLIGYALIAMARKSRNDEMKIRSKPPTCSHYFPATRTGYMDCEFCGEKHKSNKS